MTVGIGITNGTEAFSVTDAQGSMGIRKSDSYNKTGMFESENCHGVIFGSGSGNRIMNILAHIDSINGENLEDIVKKVNYLDQDHISGVYSSILQAKKRQVMQEVEVIDNSDDRKRYFESKFEKGVAEAQNTLNQYKSEFYVIGVDKSDSTMKIFYINDDSVVPVYSYHVETGSGQDAAGLYFSAKFQGLDIQKLKGPQLLFYALNAYNQANSNQGVGGTPKIVKVGNDKNSELSQKIAIPLVNLSGVYLSESHPKRT